MRKLIIVDDEGRRTTVPLVRSEITIGREEGNTIRLTERNVSRRHARIFRNGDVYRVEDRSRYGTRRNGVRIAGTETFDEGDVIIIGSYRVEMVDEHVEALPEPPRPDIEPAVRIGTEDLRAVEDAASGLPRPTPPSKPDSAARARLVCMSDPFVGSEFALTNDQMTIGTAGDCDLIIGHRSVAPHHAMFTLGQDGYELVPVDAGYPVAVNGRYNPHGPLRAGDEVLLGELKFRFALPGDDIGLVPLAEIEDESAAPGRPAWVLPAIAGVLLVVLIAGLVGLTGSDGDETTPPPAPPSAGAATVGPHAATLETGRAHLAAARWAEAVQALESVPTDAPEHETAVSLARQAVAEAEHRDRYDAAIRAFDGGDYATALDQLATLPADSYYHALAARDGLADRALTALVSARIVASRVAEEDGDLAQALRLVEEIQPRAPDDPTLAARIEELRAARPSSPEPTAREETTPRPPAPREPAPEPVRPRPSEAARAPEPAPAEPARRSDTTEDRHARASELRQQAARAGVRQDYQEAIRLLEEARELNPGDAQINLMLFSNYRQIGHRSRAAAAIRRYLRQRPDDPRRAEYEAWLAENDAE